MRKNEKAEQLLNRVIRNLKTELYEYIYALDVFKFVAVKEKIPISTDGIHLFYNPDEVIKNYMFHRREYELQIAHIMIHGLLGHFNEITNFRNKRLINAVMDAQVEELLEKMGMVKRRKGGISKYMQDMLLDNFQGYSSYYEALRNKRLRKSWKSFGSELQRDSHDYWEKEIIRLRLQKSIQDEGNSGANKESMQQRLQEVWNKARKITLGAENSANMAKRMEEIHHKKDKQQGKGAGNRVEQIEAAKHGGDYRQVLREFLREKERCQEDVSSIDTMLYTYGLDLYGDVPLVEPNEVNEILQLNNLFLAIDTSGSCSNRVARQFVREIYNLLDELKEGIHFENIYLIQCDDEIQKEEHFSSVEELEELGQSSMELEGFGGTSFVPVFQRIQQCKCQYKNVGFFENKYVGKPTFLFSIFLIIFCHILHLVFKSI